VGKRTDEEAEEEGERHLQIEDSSGAEAVVGDQASVEVLACLKDLLHRPYALLINNDWNIEMDDRGVTADRGDRSDSFDG
jgi:hypothetical protein